MPRMIANTYRIRSEGSRVFIELTTDKGRKYDFEFSPNAIPALQKHLAGALGAADQFGSSGAEAPIISFQCDLDPDNQIIYFRFGSPNREPFVLTLPVPRAIEVFESLGKALSVARAKSRETRQ